jgi:hypothetical protein
MSTEVVKSKRPAKGVKAPKPLADVTGFFFTYHQKMLQMPPSVGKKLTESLKKKGLDYSTESPEVHAMIDKSLSTYVKKKESSRLRAASKKVGLVSASDLEQKLDEMSLECKEE